LAEVEKKLPGKKRMTEFWENARALRFLHGVIEGRNLTNYSKNSPSSTGGR
jgi:hypothetical protein